MDFYPGNPFCGVREPRLWRVLIQRMGGDIPVPEVFYQIIDTIYIKGSMALALKRGGERNDKDRWGRDNKEL